MPGVRKAGYIRKDPISTDGYGKGVSGDQTKPDDVSFLDDAIEEAKKWREIREAEGPLRGKLDDDQNALGAAGQQKEKNKEGSWYDPGHVIWELRENFLRGNYS